MAQRHRRNDARRRHAHEQHSQRRRWRRDLRDFANGPTITNGTFTETRPPVAGRGDPTDLAELVINGGTFMNNSVSPNGDGGAIFNEGTLTVTGVTFINNSVVGTAGSDGLIPGIASAGGGGGAGLGGAIASSGTLSVSASTFTFNKAIGGAGGIGTVCLCGSAWPTRQAVRRRPRWRRRCRISGDTHTLNAINNWWNSASGLGSGPGSGDGVSTFVTFSPF